MKKESSSNITILEMIKNNDNLYEGNLKHYFKVLLESGCHNNNPYHNLRHSLHATWLCYQACIFYKDVLSKIEIRGLLITAMFHDFNHTGLKIDDKKNIHYAIIALQRDILPIDTIYLKDIADMISNSEYPHIVPTQNLSLVAQILRDADVAQGFSDAWMQQVLIGFKEEWKMPLLEVIEVQIIFHKNLVFHTAWAKERFPQTVIDKRIQEYKELLEILSE